VAVLGGEPEVMFRKAITEMGGMSNFINKGDKVWRETQYRLGSTGRDGVPIQTQSWWPRSSSTV